MGASRFLGEKGTFNEMGAFIVIDQSQIESSEVS